MFQRHDSAIASDYSLYIVNIETNRAAFSSIDIYNDNIALRTTRSAYT